MEKIIVIGCPGSGKSTFSRLLSIRTEIPLYHLDMMYWNPDRTTVEKTVFLDRLKSILDKEEWIIDGNYASTLEQRLEACDTVIFLDYPTKTCLEGIRERMGKPRSDMPWIENEEDEEFVNFVKEYNEKQRPKIMELLEKYSDKRIYVFKGRDEANSFVCYDLPVIKLKTERLLIREYTCDDFDNLYSILSDAETMAHYPHTYDEKGTQSWLNWCIETSNAYEYGLWALELRKTGEYIGDCGVSMQNIDGETLPEIGYHINKRFWRKGYAKEAAKAVRDWFFEVSDYDSVYSYMKYTNVASYSTAESIGMRKIKEYPDPLDKICYVYRITRDEWKAIKEQEDGK